MAIARNRRTPANILRKMQDDANYLVASQADVTLGWQRNKRRAIDRRIARASKKTFSIRYEEPAAWIAEAVRADGGKAMVGTIWEQFLSFEVLWNPALVPPDVLEEAWTEEEMERFADWACQQKKWDEVDPVAAQAFGESPRMMRLLEQEDWVLLLLYIVALCDPLR